MHCKPSYKPYNPKDSEVAELAAAGLCGEDLAMVLEALRDSSPAEKPKSKAQGLERGTAEGPPSAESKARRSSLAGAESPAGTGSSEKDVEQSSKAKSKARPSLQAEDESPEKKKKITKIAPKKSKKRKSLLSTAADEEIQGDEEPQTPSSTASKDPLLLSSIAPALEVPRAVAEMPPAPAETQPAPALAETQQAPAPAAADAYSEEDQPSDTSEKQKKKKAKRDQKNGEKSGTEEKKEEEKHNAEDAPQAMYVSQLRRSLSAALDQVEAQACCPESVVVQLRKTLSTDSDLGSVTSAGTLAGGALLVLQQILDTLKQQAAAKQLPEPGASGAAASGAAASEASGGLAPAAAGPEEPARLEVTAAAAPANSSESQVATAAAVSSPAVHIVPPEATAAAASSPAVQEVPPAAEAANPVGQNGPASAAAQDLAAPEISAPAATKPADAADDQKRTIVEIAKTANSARYPKEYARLRRLSARADEYPRLAAAYQKGGKALKEALASLVVAADSDCGAESAEASLEMMLTQTSNFSIEGMFYYEEEILEFLKHDVAACRAVVARAAGRSDGWIWCPNRPTVKKYWYSTVQKTTSTVEQQQRQAVKAEADAEAVAESMSNQWAARAQLCLPTSTGAAPDAEPAAKSKSKGKKNKDAAKDADAENAGEPTEPKDDKEKDKEKEKVDEDEEIVKAITENPSKWISKYQETIIGMIGSATSCAERLEQFETQELLVGKLQTSMNACRKNNKEMTKLLADNDIDGLKKFVTECVKKDVESSAGC